jgi:hypothetical protein
MSTNNQPDPVEHDTELFRLLGIVADAQATVDYRAEAVLASAAVVNVGHDYEAMMVPTATGGTTRMARADLPVGTIYRQAKTWQRGEAGVYIVTANGHRRAGVDDALAYLADGKHDEYADRTVERYNEGRRAVRAAHDAVVAHERAYTGWNRYFLVTSSAGHVHRSMNCSTCNPRTTYAPVVALSGRTDADAVATLGETLCTVCFPDAPVDGRPSKITAAKVRKLVA